MTKSNTPDRGPGVLRCLCALDVPYITPSMTPCAPFARPGSTVDAESGGEDCKSTRPATRLHQGFTGLRREGWVIYA